ncbi:MAG: aconitase/3-isopropylmalate dehydratase large subunit family protein [Alphaproteobacteria bacterium]|jgi:3-isopropylmalate/(R)-2-methylmalate dehydratase large subunit|nr:aconitase/3-isopropylmalate dehydratase large subunit family protein [Alphaproteobacteria bacterium]MDP6564471.1 aconitase/3-isopropylmalate dehydratase large subunit family protein [Alphaproteobacteria bacterium]MDP6816306.1 aconitase/3-isopropylmalate dehydratase large subunit family protein [Alphaproteobacteria bacterium]
MGMTAIEKILARNGDGEVVRPGDIVTVRVETAILFDNNFMDTTWREILEVKDPGKVIVVFDHRAPAAQVASARAHKRGREFVRQFGIDRFHDIGPEQGISHVLVADHGYGLPGTVLVCGDSHTCSAGVFNLAARGVGAPDMTYAVTMGETWFRVGETIRYDLHGTLPPGVFAKDVFLYLADRYGDHATLNIEVGGPALAALPINARRTLATMAAELSAEFATFEPDEIMLAHVRARTQQPFEAQYPDADAVYADRRRIDLDAIEPLVALPDTVLNNSRPLGDVAGTPIDQAFVGSCANGTLDDLEVTARVLHGRRIDLGVRMIVTPGSQGIYREALRLGYLQSIVDAGAVVTNATCGACGGGSLGVLGPGETCITASTRNFKGRMGDPSARIFMASPATVAASAIAGTIASPLAYFR